jgi:ferric-dicitrate binding protein FerR (iron transport regulator)
VFAASRGQRAEIRLTDGTQVVLAADSRITIPADFDSTRRTVTLVGEAYFDVVHNNLKPFVVNVRGAVVRDIGTRFDVRAYPADASVRLVVTHGEVKLRNATAPDISGRLLHAGQLTRMDSQGVISEVRSVDTAHYVAWTRGSLEFIDTPMPDVATEIGRWYDVDIHLKGSALTTRRLTATVRDQPLSGMLEQLAVSLDARLERHGRAVILTPKLAPTPSNPDGPGPVPARDDPSYHS